MILVTGAEGLIGSRLIPHFVSSGLNVLPLHMSERVNILDDRWEANLTRIDHIEVLKRAKQKLDTVVHLAGYVEIFLQADKQNPCAAPIPGPESISRIYVNNVVATANVLDFCLDSGVKHLVFASSQTVYGIPMIEVLTGGSPCVPLEHYASSKVCCEQLLRIGAQQGISVTVLRFPGIYSEERRNGVVYEFCKAAVHEKKITVTADFPLPLDVIYIDDVVDSLKRAVQYGKKKWLCLNVATGEPCSLDLLADAVAELVPGCEVEHSKLPQPVVKMDSSRAYEILGWKAIPRSERLRFVLDRVRNDRKEV